jgi:C-terminal processing protease CtpA/Prc
MGPTQNTDPQGTTPQITWPAMTRAEALAEIDRVSGRATRLQALRQALPTAPSRRPSRSLESTRGPREASAGAGRALAATTVAGALSHPERLTVIDQAVVMLEGLYAHLPLKRALHAIDPLQRLRLLRLRHEALDEREFQSEMIDIFVGLRDLHTNYILPTIYHRKYAYLPFRVEEFYAGGERKYLVSWVSPRNTDAKLLPGVEVTHWNGMPIDLAVARNAAREAGSNLEARRAQGVEALTLRWFGMSLPPDEDWVVLTYLGANGAVQESRFEWEVIEPEALRQLRSNSAAGTSAEHRARIGVDVKTELLRRVRKALFDPPAVRAEAEMAEYRHARAGRKGGPARGARRTPRAPRAAVSVLPDVYPRFGPVTTPSGTFGYVRLATFAPEDEHVPPDTLIDMAVNEFVRILRTLPSSGLILDVRGNGGGYVNFGERILQTFSPRSIVPEPFHFVTSDLTLRLAGAEAWLKEWEESLEMALSTGAGFSQGFPLTNPFKCNDIGQTYQGPVVLITDALCYSTTDIFAAGFQDHALGTIIGVHGNTGAGGANVWDHFDVLERLGLNPNPFVKLPRGASMRVAARRSTRVGMRSGVPLEDLGVVPDERYFMTRNDLLQRNVDLIARAAKILKSKPTQTLELAAAGKSPFAKVEVRSTNVDRVDLLVDGRPVVASTDIVSSPAAISIALPKPVTSRDRVEAYGYRKGELVVSTRLGS